jgi:hypothetical protein
VVFEDCSEEAAAELCEDVTAEADTAAELLLALFDLAQPVSKVRQSAAASARHRNILFFIINRFFLKSRRPACFQRFVRQYSSARASHQCIFREFIVTGLWRHDLPEKGIALRAEKPVDFAGKKKTRKLLKLPGLLSGARGGT